MIVYSQELTETQAEADNGNQDNQNEKGGFSGAYIHFVKRSAIFRVSKTSDNATYRDYACFNNHSSARNNNLSAVANADTGYRATAHPVTHPHQQDLLCEKRRQ